MFDPSFDSKTPGSWLVKGQKRGQRGSNISQNCLLRLVCASLFSEFELRVSSLWACEMGAKGLCCVKFTLINMCSACYVFRPHRQYTTTLDELGHKKIDVLKDL